MDHQALSYRATIDWLFDLQFVGIKMGLENIRSLAAFWGDPQRRYPVIHIAGTNGKGSTASFIAGALRAAGYRTGLYTSPHLVDFSERIRVDGIPITEGRVVQYARELRAEIERLQATFFEATTLMAFRHFAEEKVDVAVIETGLGGRLDATNVVEPVLTVITSISIEHTEFLGDTLAEIAGEKAGIMKAGVPCISADQRPEALAALRRRAAELRIPLEIAALPADALDRAVLHDLERMELPLPGFGQPVEVGLVGRHQAENAAVAAAALRRMATALPKLDESAMRAGLCDVRRLSGLRGRLELLQRRPELVVDVGHNPDGIRVMLDAWAAVRSMDTTDLVFGTLRSKDIRGIFRLLRERAPRSVTLVQAESHEARPLEDMLRIAREEGVEAACSAHVAQAVAYLLSVAKRSPQPGSVLLFGSHYVVGAFLREWPKKTTNDADVA